MRILMFFKIREITYSDIYSEYMLQNTVFRKSQDLLMQNLQITKTVKLKEVQVLPLGGSEAL